MIGISDILKRKRGKTIYKKKREEEERKKENQWGEAGRTLVLKRRM